MFSTISNINLMRKPATVVAPQDSSGIWMIGNSPTAGYINVSTDYGTTWNNYNSNIGIVLGIAYGRNNINNPVWIATGSTNITISTNSGVSWGYGVGISFSYNSTCAAFGKNGSGQNLFMVGGVSSSGNIIFSSPDGTTWTGIMPFNGTMSSVTDIKYGQMGDGTPVWIAVGTFTSSGSVGIAYSLNGSSWAAGSITGIITPSKLFSVSYGIDNSGNKRWLVTTENATLTTCIYTLANPGSTFSGTWAAVPSARMIGRCYSITFGRGVSGNVWIAAGGVGTGSGNTIVTYDGITATGYVPIPANQIPYAGCSVGYLTTPTSGYFYSTTINEANKISISQYGSSWTRNAFTYVVNGNQVNGKIVSNNPYL